MAVTSESSIRVLQLVDNLDVGGLERVVANLCAVGPADPVRFYLGCLSHLGELGERVVVPGVWVGAMRPNGPAIQLGVLNRLCRFIRKHRLSLIHSHNTKAFLYGTLASIVTRVPQIGRAHV